MTEWIMPKLPGAGDPELFSMLRWNLGANLDFSRVAATELSCSAAVWDHIEDLGGDSRVRKLNLNVDLRYRVKRGPAGTTVSGPGRVAVNRAVVEMYRALGQSSQGALLPQLFHSLTRIPAIHQVMTPLRAFILELGDSGEIRPSARSFRRYDAAKAKRYLSVLENLDYVKQVEGTYVSSKKLNDAVKYGESADVVSSILADALATSSEFMIEVLGWKLMVPYLRWSNAYYWKALEANDLPKLSKDSWTQSHLQLYGSPTHGNPRTQIDDMVRQKIVTYEGGGFRGNATVFDPYRKQAMELPIVQQVLVGASSA